MKDPRTKNILELIPAIRMILSAKSLKSGSFVPLDQMAETGVEQVTLRLGRKITVLEGTNGEILEKMRSTPVASGEYFYIKGLGILGLSVNKSKIEQKLATIRKTGRAALLSEPVAPPQIRSFLYNRIIAITGGAMGFGEGIARSLFTEGANVIILDINQKAGTALANELNGYMRANRAWYIPTDVTDLDSVSKAVYETVLEFSGLDVMISNAGVLEAGAIEEMDMEAFEFVTRVNYQGYVHCVKASIPVMKQQNHFSNNHFGDIIQINSKSGLEGSQKNFAYAGSKFGGIGLTQSFAKELIADRIKVNAICPGNYFEGPLWSDPKNGLFVQYLKAGKVPGAKTVADVKRHYESMVPAGRGCRVEDVVKAIRYVISQEYETGQAIPVTGGQVMLG